MPCVIPEDRSKDAWIAAAWKQGLETSGPTRVHRHVSDPGKGFKGEDLCRKHWTTLNRLRKGKGKGSFYIAQYPVRWTAESALHCLPSLADLFIPTPTRLLREAF